MIKRCLFVFVVCMPYATICAQKKAFSIPDSLKGRDYEYLFGRIEKTTDAKARKYIYMPAFLAKAKSERNWEEMVNGYRNYVHYSDLKEVYADSMTSAALSSGNNVLAGDAYLSKGIMYYGQKRYMRALDNYLIANNYISKTDEQYLLYKDKYNIALIKYYLGYYHEAISLLKQCIVYFVQDDDTKGYLNSIHALGLCYNKIGNYGLCSQTNQAGLREGIERGDREMDSYFIHSEGMNQYCLSNYSLAMEKIKAALPTIRRKGDFANETIGYFYLGKCYWKLNQKEKAVAYFKRVDKSFADNRYIRPDLRENYELLIQYYKEKGKQAIQLQYVDRLLRADSILYNRYEYLSGKIHKEYDTRELVLEKKKIEKVLEGKNHNEVIFIAVISTLFVLLLMLAYRYITNKRIYRQKFEELMRDGIPKDGEGELKKINPDDLKINQEAVDDILSKLEKFEKSRKFLDKDLTLVKLAASFNSNTKYISQIIYYSRSKKFVTYINDLKIDHLIAMMREDKKLWKYTNKALAEEVGFSTTQRFANAFYARTGMPVPFFIQELNNGQS